MTHPILELQAADTMADQLRHRREHLAEREQVQALQAEYVRWDQARRVMRKRLEELEAIIAKSEKSTHEIDTHLARLAKQMKTVIAPREAEALQHEIDNLKLQRDQLDDAELAALEDQARIDDEMTAHAALEDAMREELMAAGAAMSSAEADIDGELERIASRLGGLRDQVDPKLLKRYDRIRGQHMVAAASLAGSRCEGCHLDLSAHEVDEVNDAIKAGGLADCPQCGRLLVN